MRVITFSSFDEHWSLLFKRLQIVKLIDLVELQLAILMYKFHNRLLTSTLNDPLTPKHRIHSYNTRISAKDFTIKNFYYGIFNIGYQGAKVGNELIESYKIMSICQFEQKIKANFIHNYQLFLTK